jgi:outer membrane protein
MKGMRTVRITKCLCFLAYFLLINYASGLAQYDSEIKQEIVAKETLTLDKAIEISLTHNQQLMQAHYNREASDYQFKNAISNLLPAVQINQGFSRIDSNTFNTANAAKDAFELAFNLPPGTIPPFVFRDTYSTTISLNQPIYYGGALRAGIDLARSTKRMGEYSLEDVRKNVILETQRAFFNFLKSKEMLALMERSLELAEANLRDTKLKMDQGLRSRSDMLRWEVQVANERSKLIETENNLALSKINLQNVLGVDFSKQYRIIPISPEYFSWIYNRSTELIGEEQESLLKIAAQAAERHPLTKIASSDVKMKSAQVDVAKSSFKPQVSLNYSYGWRQNDTLALDDYQTWSASLQVSMSIFNGFGNIWNLKKSQRELKASRETKELAKRNVIVQFIAAFYNVKSALARIEVADIALEQAEENLRIVKDRFDLGMASNIELIDAQVTHTTSEINQLNSRYDLLIAVAELERALGHPLK